MKPSRSMHSSISSAEWVAVDPDFGSKSSTGSMIAARFVSGSATMYWMLKVRFSKKPFTTGCPRRGCLLDVMYFCSLGVRDQAMAVSARMPRETM